MLALLLACTTPPSAELEHSPTIVTLPATHAWYGSDPSSSFGLSVQPTDGTLFIFQWGFADLDSNTYAPQRILGFDRDFTDAEPNMDLTFEPLDGFSYMVARRDRVVATRNDTVLVLDDRLQVQHRLAETGVVFAPAGDLWMAVGPNGLGQLHDDHIEWFEMLGSFSSISGSLACIPGAMPSTCWSGVSSGGSNRLGTWQIEGGVATLQAQRTGLAPYSTLTVGDLTAATAPDLVVVTEGTIQILSGDQASSSGAFVDARTHIRYVPVGPLIDAEMALKHVVVSDVMGSSVPDLLVTVGASRNAGSEVGAVAVFEGPVSEGWLTLADASAIVVLDVDGAPHMTSLSVHDLTFDGEPELILGAVEFDERRGAVFALDGAALREALER